MGKTTKSRITRLTRVTDQPNQQHVRANEPVSKEEIENSSSSDYFASQCQNNDIEKKLALDSVCIKIEDDMDSEEIPESSHLAPKKIKMECSSVFEQALPPKVNSRTKLEHAVALNKIKDEVGNLNTLTQIKVEKDSDSEDQSNISKGKCFVALPEINHISVGEIKIEDGICSKINLASGEESFDNETLTADEDKGNTSAKIIKKENSDDVDMSSQGENSSSVPSKWNDEDDIPTTSRKIKKEKTNSPEKTGQGLKIKQETNNESDSDDDQDAPSDNEEEFLSNDSGGEEFLSDGDENGSDNQNLSVNNKTIVTHLIDQYHKKPQLWYKELTAEMSELKEQQLYRNIKNDLNKKFDKKFNVNRIREFLELLFKQYEEEIERQLKENEETTPESSNLWFYDKLFFLKDEIENNVKLKLQKTLTVLDDNNLADLIDIYKSYNELWDNNNPSFPNRMKRHERMLSMCLEIKNKLKITLNTFRLEYQLLNLHKNVREEKIRRYACEFQRQEYKPLFLFTTKSEFLQDHQDPFKCLQCTKILKTYQKFRNHKAQHDGVLSFKCNICEKEFKTDQALNHHSVRHNGVNYNCSICEKQFFNPITLKDHLKMFHATPTEEETFNCDVCGKAFANLTKVKQHRRLMHVEQPLLCKECGKIFKSQTYLRRHKYRHSDKICDCSICERRFNHPNDLRQHMKRVHTFTCKICGEVCLNKENLNYHMASHEGKQMNCDICGKGFDDQQQVENHKTIVHPQMGIQCEICNKFFNSRQSFYYHGFAHEDKKYDCSICWKRFSHPHILERHKRSHDQKFKCEFCGNTFGYKHSMIRHVCKGRDKLKD